MVKEANRILRLLGVLLPAESEEAQEHANSSSLALYA
jgi:hypothetical protein